MKSRTSSARLGFPMHAARIAVSLRQGMMIETSGKFLSVAGICFAIASISIGGHTSVSSVLMQIIGHHASLTKFFLRVAFALKTIS